MWSYGQASRSNIDEANKHLQALMERVAELETTVKEQQLAIAQKDQATQMQLMETAKERDQEVKKLQRQLSESQKMLDKADDACREKDMLIARLQEKSDILSELVKFRPMMDKMTHCLHNAAKLCVNDSDEEKNKSSHRNYLPSRSSSFHASSQSLRKTNSSMKAAHSMINLSTSNEFYEDEAMANKSRKQIKDRLAKSLLTGSTYDLRDEDFLNSAVSYEVDSPSHGGKELYL